MPARGKQSVHNMTGSARRKQEGEAKQRQRWWITGGLKQDANSRCVPSLSVNVADCFFQRGKGRL